MIYFILIVLILLVIIVSYIKWSSRPETFARTLTFPMLVAYHLEKKTNPGATAEQLGMAMIETRLYNPTGSRGLTKEEAILIIQESTNIADIISSICIRDLIYLGGQDRIYPAVTEILRYLMKKGFVEEVKSSNVFKEFMS